MTNHPRRDRDPLTEHTNGTGTRAFEAVEPGAAVLSGEAVLAGRVVVMAAAVPHPQTGAKFPAVVFRFVLPDRTLLPDVILPLLDDEAIALGAIVTDAAEAAREAARA